ncbi:enoyl-CoA hydratase/isomerase family protein [Streptomyces sp. NPDC090499]|uniref:enoyl-CoA hydratase/isomerase family protein n=1 Tax=Streptomyces sp. NPDC090499 TaxID=3365965 RepID=UPI0038170329
MALCADHRIAADDARRGQPEILLGLIPGAGGTQRLARLIGPARAKDVISTGRRITSDAIGLVDRAVPTDEVHAQAHAWAARLARARPWLCAPRRRRWTAGWGAELLDTGLALERTLFAGLFATEDREHAELHREGVR